MSDYVNKAFSYRSQRERKNEKMMIKYAVDCDQSLKKCLSNRIALAMSSFRSLWSLNDEMGVVDKNE